MYASSPQTLPNFVEGRGGGGFAQAKVRVPLYECTELISYPHHTPDYKSEFYGKTSGKIYQKTNY